MPNIRRAPGLPTVEQVQAGELFFSDHLAIKSTVVVVPANGENPAVTSHMLTLNCLGPAALSGLHAAGSPRWEYADYDLCLTLREPPVVGEWNYRSAKEATIYIDETSRHYVVRGHDGQLKDGSLEDLDLTNLASKLGDAAFKREVLAVTSRHGHVRATSERYARIASGLALAADKQNLDVIALQEVAPVLMLDSLKASLGDAWEVIPNQDHMITCYRKSAYTLLHSQEETGPADEHVRGLALQHIATQQLVDIYNVWGFYRPFPRLTEQYFDSLLARKQGHAVTVILSDSNSRVAPLHDRPMNITTGVIPLTFNEQNGAPAGIQTTDYPDVIFYRDLLNYTYQTPRHVVDLHTGEVSEDRRTREDADPWSEYRMLMCLDDTFKVTPIINDQTIFGYEAALQRLFDSELIQCRVAADSFNSKAIGLRLIPRSPLATYLNEKLGSESGVQTKFVQGTETRGVESSRPFSCIFVPFDKISLLHRAIIECPTVASGQIVTILKAGLAAIGEPGSNKHKALTELINKIYELPLGTASVFLAIHGWKAKYIETSDPAMRITVNPVSTFLNFGRDAAWSQLLVTLDAALSTIETTAEAEQNRSISWSPLVNSGATMSSSSGPSSSNAGPSSSSSVSSSHDFDANASKADTSSPVVTVSDQPTSIFQPLPQNETSDIAVPAPQQPVLPEPDDNSSSDDPSLEEPLDPVMLGKSPTVS